MAFTDEAVTKQNAYALRQPIDETVIKMGAYALHQPIDQCVIKMNLYALVFHTPPAYYYGAG